MYIETLSLIGWVHTGTQNDPYCFFHCKVSIVILDSVRSQKNAVKNNYNRKECGWKLCLKFEVSTVSADYLAWFSAIARSCADTVMTDFTYCIVMGLALVLEFEYFSYYKDITWMSMHLISPLNCFFNKLFELTTKKASRLYITGPFFRGIHQWPVDSPHKGTVMVIKNFHVMMMMVPSVWGMFYDFFILQWSKTVSNCVMFPLCSPSMSMNFPSKWFYFAWLSSVDSPRGHCGGGPFNEVLTGVKQSTTEGQLWMK